MIELGLILLVAVNVAAGLGAFAYSDDPRFIAPVLALAFYVSLITILCLIEDASRPSR